VNHLGIVERLANRYFVMRHGQSKANVAGIIVSRIETDAAGDYGLSELGREQVLATARRCGLLRGTLVCSSDFARATQTARIMAAQLASPDVIVAPALRERCFGAWEGTSADNYRKVWAADEAAGGGDGVEPADAVLDRATALVMDLEAGHADRDILLVSHGDTLQILQAGFARMEAARHRRLPQLETAEIRRMHLQDGPGTR
jgi:probable phosphoglycerate mutase